MFGFIDFIDFCFGGLMYIFYIYEYLIYYCDIVYGDVSFSVFEMGWGGWCGERGGVCFGEDVVW